MKPSLRANKITLALLTFLVLGAAAIRFLAPEQSPTATRRAEEGNAVGRSSPASMARLGAESTEPGDRDPAPLSSDGTSSLSRHFSHAEAPAVETALRDFRLWTERYVTESEAEARRSLLEAGKHLAVAHRQALKQLIVEDPRSALAWAVPMVTRQQLPAEILSRIEKRINARGIHRVIAIDSDSSEAPLRHIVEANGICYDAHVSGRRIGQPTTDHLYVVGIAVDRSLALDERPLRPLEQGELPDPLMPQDCNCPIDGSSPHPQRPTDADRPIPDEPVLVEAGGTIHHLCSRAHARIFEQQLIAYEGATGGPLRPSGPIPTTISTGVKTCLYVRVAFPETKLEPQTETAACEMMRLVNDWYVENSYGSLFLLTTVAPLVILPHSEAFYTGPEGDEFSLRVDALLAAAAMGYDPDSHDLDIVAYTGGPGNFNGAATIGGRGVWLKNFSVGTAAHELGHNLGLNHANSWNTNNRSTIGDGSNLEYGNTFDTMGTASAGNLHFGAAMKNQLGWLTDQRIHEIRRSGIYRIQVFDQPQLDPTCRYGLRIRKDAERSYWGEFRQKFGTSNPWLRDGLLLNWGPWSKSGGGTHLLDTTPGTPDGRTDAALILGRTFSDHESGVHITPVGKGATSPESIDVVVNLGTFTGNQPPVATVNADQVNVAAGTPVNLTVVATDPDDDSLAYSWDFGDNTFSNSNSPVVTKSWTAAGNYVARCLVSDLKGGIASDSVVVQVGSPTTFTISGQVTSGGFPLPNVRVHNGLSNSNYRGAYTDSDGNYTITGLASGNVTVSAALYGYTFASTFTNPITIGPSFTSANFTATSMPRVSITATDPDATEGAGSASFAITRTGSTSSTLTVAVLAPAGSASRGADYALSPEPVYSGGNNNWYQFTIAAGQSSRTVNLNAHVDGMIEGPETATLELLPTASYVIAGFGSATAVIGDADTNLPMVGIQTLVADARESGGTATIVVSRTGPTNNPLTVEFTRSGTATQGIDYEIIGTSLTIPAGQTSVDLLIDPVQDATTESDEDVVISLSTDESYLLDSRAFEARAFICDDDLPILTIAATDSNASESAQDPATFVITRSGDTSMPVTACYALAGSAQHGIDYATLPGNLTIPAGSRTGSITVIPVNDGIGEPIQTVIVQLRGGADYVVGNQGTATASIADNDAPVVTVGVTDGVLGETAGTGQLKFTTTGSGSGNVTVRYTVTGTASSGTDYNALSGTLSMGRNNTSTVTVTPIDDSLAEGLETIVVTIDSDPAYTTFLDKTATLNLIDDDATSVNITAGAAYFDEANDTVMVFHLNRQGSTASNLTLSYSMSGTASNGVDYVDYFTGNALSGTATIPAGESSVDVWAVIINDNLREGTETVTLTLTPDPTFIAETASLTQYLPDDESPLVQVRFSQSTGSGDEGVGNVEIPVTLSAPSASPVTVEYAIAGGSATGGIDYVVTSGLLTFDPGVTAQSIPLILIDDDFDEPAQTVIIELRNAWHASQGTSHHTYTIQDNDASPAAFVGFAATASAAGENVTQAQPLVTLSEPRQTPVVVNYFAGGGTATGGGVDYTLDPGTLTFAPGETALPLPFTIVDDPLEEPDETIIVTLDTPSGATLGTNTTHTYTIQNTPGILAVTPAAAFDSSGTSGGPFSPASTTYTLANTADTPIDWTASTNAAWVDLSATGGTLAPGATAELTVSFNAQAESLLPQLHTATVTFTNTTNHNGDTGREVNLTVLTPPVTVGFATSASAAGENVTPALLQVTLSAPQPTPVSVHYAATDGTATGGGVDYTLEPGTLTFAPGETTLSIPITIVDDPLEEPDETIVVTLDSPAGATLGTNTTHTYTIQNMAGILAVTPPTGLDGSGAGGGPFSPASVTYTLSNVADTPIEWTAGANAAWVGLDLAGGTLAPGATTQVTASLTPHAATLLPQLHTATLAFTNTTNHQGDASRDVSLSVSQPPWQPNSIAMVGDSASLRFWGVPGTDYQIQRSTDLDTWVSLSVKTAPANGIIEFTDTAPPPGKAFYRTSIVP